jgi:hypothetical protein
MPLDFRRWRKDPKVFEGKLEHGMIVIGDLKNP